MAKFSCFPVSVLKRKNKDKKCFPESNKKEQRSLNVKLEHPVHSTDDCSNLAYFSVSIPFELEENKTCEVKVLRDENFTLETDYEGGDEHEKQSIPRVNSDFDLHSQVADKSDGSSSLMMGKDSSNAYKDTEKQYQSEYKSEREEETTLIVQSGHVSDPGVPMIELSSPKLKRSCSNLETRRNAIKSVLDQCIPNPSSFDDLQILMENTPNRAVRLDGSPLSIVSSCSADKVMLKKNSSSQVLPSRSKRLWWKLFLWSHRNTHKPLIPKPKQAFIPNTFKHKDGYTSDTLEPIQSNYASNLVSISPPFPCDLINEGDSEKVQRNDYKKDDLPNQWMAFFSASSPSSRVDEWVNSLHSYPDFDVDEDERSEIVYPPSPHNDESYGKANANYRHINVSEDSILANNVVRSLNSLSTVAHISGMGLKTLPSISIFSSLRSINLSKNSIAHITPGSLPKSLHILNLSKNKITAIEGLRELTHLRVLDLSYNCIQRIGHGLSACVMIKELYLAGNKISEVDGLHRLCKLAVLDLSFNRISTTKSLGQLVANYKSIQAINLLGNPIQTNLGEDQLKKTVPRLLPHLRYLNRQTIKPSRVQDVMTDSVGKAALGTTIQYRRSGLRSVNRINPTSGSLRGKSLTRTNKGRSRNTRTILSSGKMPPRRP